MPTSAARALGKEPAHPYAQIIESYHQSQAQHRGLTKREAFAGAAMRGLLSAGGKRVAKQAVDEADGLLAELAKSEAR